jgi:uncharacterized OB-fold protein
VVEFENGVRAMGQVEAEDGEEFPLGTEMQPVWEPVREQYGEHVYGLRLKRAN